jgi:hypothetical protein
MQYDGEAVKAADYIPEQIQPHQLPLFINFTGGRATRVHTGDTFYQITRQWNIRLYGRKEGDGLRSENEARMLDLIDLTYDLFVSRPRLELDGEGLTNVVSGLLTGDSDIQTPPYPSGESDDAAFYTVTFSMDVVYRSIC